MKRQLIKASVNVSTVCSGSSPLPVALRDPRGKRKSNVQIKINNELGPVYLGFPQKQQAARHIVPGEQCGGMVP